jgi:hypothetical protein
MNLTPAGISTISSATRVKGRPGAGTGAGDPITTALVGVDLSGVAGDVGRCEGRTRVGVVGPLVATVGLALAGRGLGRVGGGVGRGGGDTGGAGCVGVDVGARDT